MRYSIIISTFILLAIFSCKDDEDSPYPYTGIEESLLDNVNSYRTSLGLTALSMNAKIREEARNHSKRLALGEVNYFVNAHEGFENRVVSIESALGEGDFAENIAAGDSSASKVLASWKASNDHHQNLIGNYESTGIGVAKSSEELYFYVQIFYQPTK